MIKLISLINNGIKKKFNKIFIKKIYKLNLIRILLKSGILLKIKNNNNNLILYLNYFKGKPIVKKLILIKKKKKFFIKKKKYKNLWEFKPSIYLLKWY